MKTLRDKLVDFIDYYSWVEENSSVLPGNVMEHMQVELDSFDLSDEAKEFLLLGTKAIYPKKFVDNFLKLYGNMEFGKVLLRSVSEGLSEKLPEDARKIGVAFMSPDEKRLYVARDL